MEKNEGEEEMSPSIDEGEGDRAKDCVDRETIEKVKVEMEVGRGSLFL